MNIVVRGIFRFRGLRALFFLISNLYRFIIAALLFSALSTACGFCGYIVVLRKLDSELVVSKRTGMEGGLEKG